MTRKDYESEDLVEGYRNIVLENITQEKFVQSHPYRPFISVYRHDIRITNSKTSTGAAETVQPAKVELMT